MSYKINSTTLFLAFLVLALSSGLFFIVKKYNSSIKYNEQKVADLLQKQQEAFEKKLAESQSLASDDTANLKKELESVRFQSQKQTEINLQAEKNVSNIIQEFKSSESNKIEEYGIKEKQIANTVAKIMCFNSRDDLISSGSGTVWKIDGKYYLMTNDHVLFTKRDSDYCAFVLAKDWDAVAQDPDKAFEDDNLLAYYLPAYYSWQDEGLDFAISEIEEIDQPLNLISNSYISLDNFFCKSDPQVGSKIKIIGFPYTGSDFLPTITEGIISSFEKNNEEKYYITSAKIEQGNSGGVAFSEDYSCLVGIPTLVVVGEAESLGRILFLSKTKLQEMFQEMKDFQ